MSALTAAFSSLLQKAANVPLLTGMGVALALVIVYLTYEQMNFVRKHKGRLSGPSLAIPVMGGIVEMVMDPYGFWERQREYTNINGLHSGKMSWNSIFGVFMIYSTNTAVSRRILSANGPDTLLMAVHPSGKMILGEKNLAFMHGPEHKAMRKSFLALFTRTALGVYVENQDAVMRGHLAEWIRGGKEVEIRDLVRVMNWRTSQAVFVGPYLAKVTVATVEQFSNAFEAMTKGFLSLPICLPGTNVWKGREGRKLVVRVLAECAAMAKKSMAAGGEPTCLMDFWAQKVLEESAASTAAGLPVPAYFSDAGMGDTLMDFLFASQDASTASLTWVCALLADRADVLAKVRAEQAALRPRNERITGDLLNEMTYTRQVVKEVLRFRPPATMVPQVAAAPFKLTDDYTAPKGALVIPSIWAATMEGFTDPFKFDPDRMSPARQEDVTFAQNFLTFGTGPHQCVGREYAINHLMAFTAVRPAPPATADLR